MAYKTWYHAVRDARLVYLNRDKFAYLYGGNGERPKDYAEAKALVDKMWQYYPTHFEGSVIAKGYTKEDLINHIIGKKCFDCSGFVCAVTQYNGDIMSMSVLKDMNSTSLHGVMSNETTPLSGLWGNCLWKPGHVALDVGNGLAIDFGNEFLDCREYRFVDDPAYGFSASGQLPWVDYTGSVDY